MKRPRHLFMTAALAVAFLSAGAFAHSPDPSSHVAANAAVHMTVISKTEVVDFAS